ncbi:unnamed protein product [Ectocarpus sp. CCAP 1310/34]|nr:unnamed protein product [Ectocarpus sp. CCAP 1310/34]
MFKFGFYPPSSNEEQQQEQQSAVANEDTAVTNPDQYTARRIRHRGDGGAEVQQQGLKAKQAKQQLPSRHKLWRGGLRTSLSSASFLQRTATCPDVPEESDLVPGLYEGGLKVWEASLDLVEHLLSNSSSSPMGLDGGSGEDGSVGSGTGRPKSVLELGCGHGFPGIVALQQGVRVCFSDFNREVIEQVTIPNVRLNVEAHHWPLAEYYSGDWSSLSPLLEERDGGGLFDLILTAETLYTTAVADKVLDMVGRHLAPGGQALVASKRFYFGTGGSTQYFREAIAARCNSAAVEASRRLVCSDAAVIDTGKGNIREVLRVSWEEPEEGAEPGVAENARVVAAVQTSRDRDRGVLETG